jgi:hypothetical protein
MSDFLKKLQARLNGEAQEDVKTSFTEILVKADQKTSSLQDIEKKAEELQENRKPLTLEEIEKINAESAAHEKRIKAFEAKMMKEAKIKMLQDDIAAYEEALQLKKQLLKLELESE